LYRLLQGPTEQKIIEQCIRQRRPLPDAIANSPELFFGLELYFIAYCELGTCRGPDSRISWLSISQYADALKLSEDQREDLFFYVSKMDEAWSSYHEKKRSKVEKPAESR